MLRSLALLAVAFTVPNSAVAQAPYHPPPAEPLPEVESALGSSHERTEEPVSEPAPPLAEVYTPADPDVSDTDVIRWAARELGRADGRSFGERPPPPPDRYLAHGPRAEVVVMDGEDDGLRLLAEIGGGALGLLVGGGVGTLIVWAALEGNAGGDWMMVAGGGATVFAALGVSSGVALGADATGSRGNFGHAFIGQAIGAAAAVPLVVLAFHNDMAEAAVVPAALLPLAGAVIAYEIAHAASRARDGAPPVVAYLTPTPDGVLGGVAGRL